MANVITESELRALWRDGKSPLPPFPRGTTFTPSALDFLKSHHLETQIEDSHAPAPLAQDGSPPGSVEAGRPAWDKPGEFPVMLTGPIPVCIECGQPLKHKPEHMTQLDAEHFAPKTHARIKFRGQLDVLHALVMLVGAMAREKNLPRLAGYLDTLAAYCREIQSADYNNRPVGELALAGKTAEEIHAISHHPDRYLGIQHIVPGPEDPLVLHWMNYLRTIARQTEILVLEVYPPPEREDLVLALNRFSSAVYFLELLFRSGELRQHANPFSTE